MMDWIFAILAVVLVILGICIGVAYDGLGW